MTATAPAAAIWILDDEATFFVIDEDDDYIQYSSASSAINVATPVTSSYEDGDVRSINRISAVADGDTGYVTMIAIDVSYWGSSSSGSDTNDSATRGDATLSIDDDYADVADADYVRMNDSGNITYRFELNVPTDATYDTFSYRETVYINGSSSYESRNTYSNLEIPDDGMVQETISVNIDDGDTVEVVIDNVTFTEADSGNEDEVTLSFNTTDYADYEFYGEDGDRLTVTPGNRGTSSITVEAGEEVTVWYGAVSTTPTLPDQFEIIDGGILATNNSADEEFTFEAPDADATLLSLASTPDGYYTITAGEGITLTYGDQVADAEGETILVPDGEDVDVASTTGEYFSTRNAATNEKHIGVGNEIADTTDFTVNARNETVYAVVTVTLDNTDIAASYEGTANNTVALRGERAVAVGTELTIAAQDGEGSVVIEGTGPVATEALGTTYTVGESDATLTAAWTVVLGEGVTASIDSTTRTAGTYYVADSTGIASIAATSGGSHVVELNDRGYGDADASSSLSSITEDVTLAAATQVTFTGNAIASFTYTIDGETSPSISVGSSNVVLYFVEGTTIDVVGVAGTAGQSITLSGTDAPTVENGVTSSTVEGATGSFTVGENAITVNQA